MHHPTTELNTYGQWRTRNVKINMTEEKFTLIGGVFTPKQARTLLTELYSNKIQYHRAKSFSAMERTGKLDGYSEMKINQLSTELGSITNHLKMAKEKELMVDNLKIE